MSAWRCYSCPESGTGTERDCDRAAEDHTKQARHATCTYAVAGEPPEPPPTFSKGKR